MSGKRRTIDDGPFMIVRSLGGAAVAEQDTGRHAHPWGQIIYCSAGVMTVWTEGGTWVAPPHWAIWAPAGVEHRIRFGGSAAFRTLYLRADVAQALPTDCAVLTVSALLRELIQWTVAEGMLDERIAAHRAIALLIVEEARRNETPSLLDLRWPKGEAARRAARMVTEEDRRRTAPQLAAAVGVSVRTLERRFLSETGLTLATWAKQARMLHSLRLLAAGQSVKAASCAAGFQSSSAYVAAFRDAFGRTPGRYFWPPSRRAGD